MTMFKSVVTLVNGCLLLLTIGMAQAEPAKPVVNDGDVANICDPFLMDTINVSKVTLATYVATRSYGPQVMNSLGSLVGGGNMAGAVMLGFMGSEAAAALLNKYVFYSDTKADSTARIGTYIGAVVGTAISLGTLISLSTRAVATTAVGTGAVATAARAGARAAVASAADTAFTPVIAAVLFGALAYEATCIFGK
ncbi:hypothetical protein TI04_00475 [Achromatium sp. WMS2]|nr:hypothetical protein TI04_00475 [Achromatium sp. WMS2]